MATNTQANVNYSNEIFKQYVMKLATGLVWKNFPLAQSYEKDDAQYMYRVELFMVASRGLLNFEVVRQFPAEVLRRAGVSEDSLIGLYTSDKKNIPEALRPYCVKAYTEYLTEKDIRVQHYKNYVEENNYYRMLNGLPDIDDTDYVYNTDPRWETDKPIHMMNYVDRIEMEHEGVLQKLIDANPDKEYLKYCGKKIIDVFDARAADRFEMLWMDDSDSTFLNRDFREVYNQARYMTMAVYFSKAYDKTNSLYENFIGMVIMFMTVNTLHKKYLRADITRDFYDVESLKVIYDSYSVPFYSEIPLDYHRKIVKSMNYLVNHKGSTNDFLSLFDIFDLGSMSMYNYFLTKRHRTDDNGGPTFKVAKDEHDNPILDELGMAVLTTDNYDVDFSKVKIGSDPARETSNNENDAKYEDITVGDPYWIEDENLKIKLDDAMFNYRESKYIGIQVVLDLIKITNESAYIFRMITDMRDSTTSKYMKFFWPDYGLECTLYDLVIYISALYCRLYGYEGIITEHLSEVAEAMGLTLEDDIKTIIDAGAILRGVFDDPTADQIEVVEADGQYVDSDDILTDSDNAAIETEDDPETNPVLMADGQRKYDDGTEYLIDDDGALIETEPLRLLRQSAKTLGYNFQKAHDILDKTVMEDPYLVANTELIELIQSMVYPYSPSISEMNYFYPIINNIEQVIIKGYTEAKNPKEYQAYRNLYWALLTSRQIVATYTNPATGEMFETYPDILTYYNPRLLQHFLLIEDEDLITEMNIAIDKMEELISNLLYLPFSAGLDSSSMIKALFKILKFFKSAKAELLNYDIVYAMRARGYNYIKFIMDYHFAWFLTWLPPDYQILYDKWVLELIFGKFEDQFGLGDKWMMEYIQVYFKNFIEFLDVWKDEDLTIKITENYFIFHDFIWELFLEAAKFYDKNLFADDLVYWKIISRLAKDGIHLSDKLMDESQIIKLKTIAMILDKIMLCTERVEYLKSIRDYIDMLNMEISQMKESDERVIVDRFMIEIFQLMCADNMSHSDKLHYIVEIPTGRSIQSAYDMIESLDVTSKINDTVDCGGCFKDTAFEVTSDGVKPLE